MGEKSLIEWTDSTWNPWYGCAKISQGCKNCYMFRDMERTNFNPNVVTRAMPGTFYSPLKWKEGRRIFTCSWSDFWIKEADDWRAEALEIIAKSSRHIFQILTKRPERILPWLDTACWPTSGCPIGINGLPKNVWLGVTIEDNKSLSRMAELVKIPASIRFISAEPLLEHINFPLDTIDDETGIAYGKLIHWIITGGESGPKKLIRWSKPEWFFSIREQCQSHGIAFFHKQNGGYYKDINKIWGGDQLNGKRYKEFPQI